MYSPDRWPRNDDEVRIWPYQGEPFVLVDGRPATAYEREHVPGAISLPLPASAFASPLGITAALAVRNLNPCDPLQNIMDIDRRFAAKVVSTFIEIRTDR